MHRAIIHTLIEELNDAIFMDNLTYNTHLIVAYRLDYISLEVFF